MSLRRPVASLQVPGTKPGVHAQTLVSTGQADLDRILLGGLPLGTVFCILEDAHSPHHTTLLRYFLAEGVACHHNVFYAASQVEALDLNKSLPEIVQPSAHHDEPEKAGDDSGLKIAWQYRKYIQDKQKAQATAEKKSSAFQKKSSNASSSSNDAIKAWCHTFDLARPMKDCSALPNLESRRYGGSTPAEQLTTDISRWASTTAAPAPDQATLNSTPDREILYPARQPEPDLKPVMRRRMAGPSPPLEAARGPSAGADLPSQKPDSADQQPVGKLMSLMSRTSDNGDMATSSDTSSSGLGPSSARQSSSSANSESSAFVPRLRSFMSSSAAMRNANPNAEAQKAPAQQTAQRPRLSSFMSKRGPENTAQAGAQHSDDGSENKNAARDIQAETSASPLAALRLEDSKELHTGTAAQINESDTSRNESSIQQHNPAPAATASKSRSNQALSPNVSRIAVQSFGSPHWNLSRELNDGAGLEALILMTVHRLKAMARLMRAAVMISIPGGQLSHDASIRLQHMCDACVSLEAVQDDSSILKLISDPGSCVGVLRVNKLPAVNSLSPPVPSNPVQIIRHKRRRVTIQPFEVDPDAEAALIAADSGPTANGAAALLCGGPPKAENKMFDF